MENQEKIHYLDCPHFVANDLYRIQNGYLLFDGKVYFYEADFKEGSENVNWSMSIDDFLTYAKERQIEIPEDVMAKLKEGGRNASVNERV